MKAIFPKKCTVLIVLIFMFEAVNAQMHFDIRAGIQYSSVIVKYQNKVKTPYFPGFYFGVSPIIEVFDKFSMEPAAVFVRREYKAEEGNWISWGKDFSVSTSYLELPID